MLRPHFQGRAPSGTALEPEFRAAAVNAPAPRALRRTAHVPFSLSPVHMRSLFSPLLSCFAGRACDERRSAWRASRRCALRFQRRWSARLPGRLLHCADRSRGWPPILGPSCTVLHLRIGERTSSGAADVRLHAGGCWPAGLALAPQCSSRAAARATPAPVAHLCNSLSTDVSTRG